MAHIVDSSAHETAARPGRPGVRMAVVGASVAAGALFAAAALLWARHGATVFFDIMNAGIASCL